MNVGTVKSIGFNEDRSKVVVTAELAKEVSDLARDGTNFWCQAAPGRERRIRAGHLVVRRLYRRGRHRRQGQGQQGHKLTFEGLEIPPAVTHDRPASVSLKADNLGSLDVGSPVYYRRINVGRSSGTSSTRAVIR